MLHDPSAVRTTLPRLCREWRRARRYGAVADERGSTVDDRSWIALLDGGPAAGSS